MQKLDFLDSHNLVFIDIEATDHKTERQIVQISGIRVNLDGTTQELNLVINPKQPLSNYIVNLLKIDDIYLKNKPTLDNVEDQIANFINNSVVVTFGDFDRKMIQKYFAHKNLELKFFDFQNYLKQFSKNNVALLEMHKLISDDTTNVLQHDALYDAQMLKDLFYNLHHVDEEKLKCLCSVSHILPRSIRPKHKIFSKQDFFTNNWSNNPNSNDCLIINKLVIKQLTIKNKSVKHTVPYLEEIAYSYFTNNEWKNIQWKNNFIVGEYVYEIYLEQAKKILNKFLSISFDKPIFFNQCSKDKILNFVEVIYDATKQFPTLNFVNLNYINKKYKLVNGLDKFYEIINNLDPALQQKFGHFYKKTT